MKKQLDLEKRCVVVEKVLSPACMKWAIALIRCTCTPAVEDQWNSSGVRDKSGGILQGRGQKLGNSLGLKPILEVEFFRGKQRFHGILQGYCEILQGQTHFLWKSSAVNTF